MKLSWGGFEGANELRTLSARIEEAGFDTVAAIETRHDPFIQSAVIAEHTKRAQVMTSIAVAFARTPMLLAYAAHDLNVLSGGRFILGLGSQTKPHIERRFAMPWSHPAERMKEMIQAIHAIWDCWYDGKPLAFRGQFYSHTLMTPNFTPADIGFARPPIHLAAVGPQMTEVAATIADGIICHAFTTERYVREVTLPAIEAGLAGSGPRPRAIRGHRDSLHRLRAGRGGAGGEGGGGEKAGRLLRLDAGLSRRAGASRLGRAARGTSPAVEAGALG